MALRTLNEILGPVFPMDLRSDAEPRTIPLTQRNGDVYLIPHHSVSRTLGAILGEFTKPTRTLSATAAVGPLTAGVDDYQSRHCVPWNTHRPYTTSSWIDDQAITFEMANLVLAPPWPVGQTGKQWVAELAAAMHVELGMPLDRWHVADHNTIYQRGWESYPTTCCGEDLRAALDWVVAEARRLVATNGSSTEEDEIMGAAQDIINSVASIVRREERFRRFGDNKGRRALGRPGAVIALSSNAAEANEQEKQIALANPLLLSADEVAGILPVLDETAFFTLVDAYGGGADDYGVFVKNTFDITADGGPTKMVRRDARGAEFEVPYGSRQLVWASAQPVECTYDGVVVLDFVNNAGKYEARLADGTVKVLTEVEVARANAQRPASQNWAVNA